jgi:hypothetical protein
LVYNGDGALVFDPDRQVQHCLKWLFATFARTGSASATVKAARQERLAFPHRCAKGAHKGELMWDALDHSQVLRALHNPRYAGAFVYGRCHTLKSIDGGTRLRRMPREEWVTLIPGAHAGYISWDEYERNQQRLHESAQAMGADRRRGPPREGPALLQGLVLCGRCGRRMTVRYHSRRGQLCPGYICQREGIDHGEPVCQHVPGAGVDRAIGDLLVEAVNPVALEVTLAVQRELQSSLRRGRPSAPRPGRTRAVRVRVGATPLHARGSRQPAGGRFPGGAVEREAACAGRGARGVRATPGAGRTRVDR